MVDKTKLLALFGIVRFQLGVGPERPVRDGLFERVEQLERELRRRQPRWGRLIAGLFVLLGVLADLKAVVPNVYDAAYQTVQAIIETMHVEGTAEHHRRQGTAFRGLPALPASPPREEEQ